jgi:hypothetical protein
MAPLAGGPPLSNPASKKSKSTSAKLTKTQQSKKQEKSIIPRDSLFHMGGINQVLTNDQILNICSNYCASSAYSVSSVTTVTTSSSMSSEQSKKTVVDKTN